MQKTLGGERLGSGKKMKVELQNFERSTHDMGYIWKSTMSAGTLVPFMNEIALPGDSFDIDLATEIMTHPTIGPNFDGAKVQLDVFLAPIRLYQASLNQNKLNIGMEMNQIYLPKIRLTAQPITDRRDMDNSQISPSCILNYLGIRGVGYVDVPKDRKFNAVPLLAYWEIVKQYYSNKSESLGAVIHYNADPRISVTDLDVSTDGGSTFTDVDNFPSDVNPIALLPGAGGRTIIRITTNAAGAINEYNLEYIVFGVDGGGTITAQEIADDALSVVFRNNTTGEIFIELQGGSQYSSRSIFNYVIDTQGAKRVIPIVQRFLLENIDAMRTQIMRQTAGEFVINDLAVPLNPYNWLYGSDTNGVPYMLNGQEGLALKTYQSDMFNNWIPSTRMINVNAISAVSTASGSFTIDSLLIAKKVHAMLTQIAVSGGTYDDWLDAVYNETRAMRAQSPMYMGGLIRELGFQEVVSNNTGVEGEPLGTLGGRGVMTQKKKGGNITIKVEEPSYIIGIVSITPRIGYSQGNKWDVNLNTIDDLHKPHMDGIGFQDLITEQMAWWTTQNPGPGASAWIQKSAGKQPAWMNYMTNVNRQYGNFAIKDNQMFMTFNRRYEWNDATKDIKDLTTYIDPSKFNNIFAETALDAQNFWTQIAVNIKARRKMSAKLMPNL